MYLKSIEIQGFKSFANKIIFEFHTGITGIVGPNGSGKSNVADAVRWVLGEQRIKQLRGASMQDVIFAGTELRKPQGFAYVAITLDNSDHQLAIDYDQVTVSRRLYRSGESEYMINGSICRLKDISELFYDTGIGKEGYSIIGQGQIDKILSGKPEERRELFDEAAGIVKFKRRKNIAQKKLEDEQANLIRVSDILVELEKQVGPLERQSRSAKEYLQLKEELKICDANLFLMETEGISRQLEEVERKKELLAGDMEETREGSERYKAEQEALERDLSELEDRINSGRDELNQGTVLRGSLEGQINVLNEQIHTEELNEEHLKNRRGAITEELKNRRDQLASYDEELEHACAQVKRALECQEEAQELLSAQDELIKRLDLDIETAKGGIIQALNERASLTAKQQRYETMLEQVNVRRSEVSQKLLKFKSDESVQEELIDREQSALSEIRKSLESCQIQAQNTEAALKEADEEARQLNRSLNDTQQEYHMAHTRLESLKNLAERYDGYGNSIRRVMEVRDRVRGIHGVVADLITTQRKYETAIETALGGSIQNVVTDSEETAKRLIEYLKKNKYGRVTFLPLTSINGSQNFSQPGALKEPGVLGLASDLVQAEPPYEGLVRYLLGRVVVADTIDHAVALARRYKYSLRIVTLEGELLNAGGSMTGGDFKNSSNLLGRRREIEELEEQCGKALARVEQLQKELALKERGAAEKKEGLEQLKADIQALALKENTIHMNLSQLEDKKRDIAEASVDLVREHGQLEEQAKEIAASKNTLEEDAAKLELLNQNTSREIDENMALLEEARQVRETYGADLSKAQLETANLRQKQDFIRENADRVCKEIDKLNEELDSLEKGSGSSGQIIEGKRREIERLKELMDKGEIHMEELKLAIEAQFVQKEALTGRQKELFSRREELTGRLSELDKDMFRVQAQEEKLEERLETFTSYMWTEYEMTFSTAQELKREEYQAIPQVKKQIEDLKNRIKGLGNININAIEDYKEISQRYEFLKEQYEDLTQAQAELEKIIEELDAGMRRQFQEKFGEIRAEFDKVFKELFGGGRGTLELMETDILESGIQIIAQPPGKKLQNMMQLSGGEKALTAISLLFAIQNLKPSPFCLLDEIEAALDDSNVDRFAGYLHKLIKNTQFIVITHRRGTMVSADRLYGITMQEKGVSTLVSVNLIEDSLDK
ncbi:MAG: chromosome segregation protein SMC [Clostridiaceae bacterium]|nr:chromosome segregation protein SMC [Clostridiaceae bacterium]